ncbi:hypothetical protein LIN78_14930 [Leeia sp. TBRC 13508]|uniref:Uncharacterized protein n=1 Tax=Leeia speluncae TaxID=2884804 RepID=A0ABS8D9H3_9NEIS|nr:hypothetical protein [Leeia speluncae]MCB6184840.1 hypothetical protein [Leeia speluncae]
MNRLLRSLVLIGGFAIGGATMAGEMPASQPMPEGGHGEHHMPPPEAFAACENKAKSTACVVQTPRGEMKGRCGGPEGKKLACMPDMPPKGGKGEQPPPPPKPE